MRADDQPQCPVGYLPSSTTHPEHMKDVEECPLKVKHPPTGNEYALGCGVCRDSVW